MQPDLECDIKKDVNPNMTSECWSPFTCWLFVAQCKYLRKKKHIHMHYLCYNVNENLFVCLI